MGFGLLGFGHSDSLVSSPPSGVKCRMGTFVLFALQGFTLLLLAWTGHGAESTGNIATHVNKRIRFQTEHSSKAGQNDFAISVPIHGEINIATAKDVLSHSKAAWNFVVETNKAGLVDAKMEGRAHAWRTLTEEEANHHYQAGLEGKSSITIRTLSCSQKKRPYPTLYIDR